MMEMHSKVLMLVGSAPLPDDRRVWLQAAALSEAGYEVSVVCPSDSADRIEYEFNGGIHVYRHPLSPKQGSVTGYARRAGSALLRERKIMKRIWNERGFGIIQLCNPPDWLFLNALPFKWFKKVKVVFDHRDLVPELAEVKFVRRGALYWVMRMIERLAFASSDTVISANESCREIALVRGRRQPDQVYVVRSAPKLAKLPAREPNPAHFKKKKFLVGYAGYMGHREGIDLFLQTVRYLVHEKQRRDIHFMLIGEGPALSQMRRMASVLCISAHVEFTGRLPPEETEARLASCDVCVNPAPRTPFSRYSTMDNIMEYMALGKPIVQYDLPEGRRAAEDASLYAEPNDPVSFAGKVIELLADRELRLRMGGIGYSRIEQLFEWRHQAQRLLDAYAYTKSGQRPHIPEETAHVSLYDHR